MKENYAKAVFLNAYQRAMAVKDDDSYQRYLIYECGIKKPSTFHRQMVKEGYLQETSIEENLKTLKVTELKEILESIGEKKAGKKDELVRRILDSEFEEQLCNYFSGEKKYSISQVGKDYMEELYYCQKRKQSACRASIKYKPARWLCFCLYCGQVISI